MAHPSDPYAAAYRAREFGESQAEAHRRFQKLSDREVVTQHAQRWLRELSRDLPGLFPDASDADLRRIAERVASAVLGG